MKYPARKLHNRVPQHFYLDWFDDNPGEMTAEDFAITFDVSYVTAQRKLEGLVRQGKLSKRGRPTKYQPTEK